MSKRRREKEVGIALLVSTLQKKGIQLVAIDFDQTLITFHSGGVWKDSVDKLVPAVRPCIRDLMQTCLDRDLNVCIVTYFMQPWVIRELMQKLFRRSDAERILVQANTAAFREKHNHEFLGKEAHIAAILTELYNKDHHLKIRPEEVILFDDDQDNTDIALKFGHKAFLVTDDVSEKLFEDFAKDLDAAVTRKSWIK
ncbi:uncharacterized protein LOC123533612 [Mercenaria mercenaria]|uniref:uncharacterized protein LOC123533612 n=1 Tax=Mercenaria mercenaria TaxID=6596 RepID=UPI00234EC7D0|nr:uncharacterized protein LOC123533612 [Mercenaria mercenaria]